MKVNAWKNVDIECQVDVSLDDCINELLDAAESEDGRRRKITAVDGATRILEKITPAMVLDVLERYPKNAELLRERLKLWTEFLTPGDSADAITCS